jgi:hypothetical protein
LKSFGLYEDEKFLCISHPIVVDSVVSPGGVVSIEIAPAIAPIARRLALTPSNSVPSERAFSILNLLQNKLRNCLTNQRVDKLQFIYLNERVLQRAEEKERIDRTAFDTP